MLFLRKANLAFEIDRVLRLPGPKTELALATTSSHEAEPSPSAPPPEAEAQPGPPSADANGTAGADDVKVIVTGASQQAFPRIAVQFEVKRADGTLLARRRAR